MKCETVIELTPDELAQLVAAHLQRTVGVEVTSVAIHGSGGGLLGYEKVIVKGECSTGLKPGHAVIDARIERLKRFQDQVMGAVNGVEPVHVDQEPEGPSGG